MFWLPDIAVSQVSSPPRKHLLDVRSNPVVSVQNRGSGCNTYVGCECNFLEPYFVSFVVSIPRIIQIERSLEAIIPSKPAALCTSARPRSSSERMHSEAFGRQRPGANKRSIKQFFTPSKQQQLRIRAVLWWLRSLLLMSFVHCAAPFGRQRAGLLVATRPAVAAHAQGLSVVPTYCRRLTFISTSGKYPPRKKNILHSRWSGSMLTSARRTVTPILGLSWKDQTHTDA
jgi:hypothetical protein